MSLRALRLAVVLTVSFLFSGVPQAVSAASSDCCDERCEGSLGGKECPPTCGLGACAKVRPALSVGAGTPLEVPMSPGITYAREDRRPVLPVVTSGVFHPPRP